MHENREISCTSWSKDQDRSAKAINRNADVNVQEKSDCAVVGNAVFPIKAVKRRFRNSGPVAGPDSGHARRISQEDWRFFRPRKANAERLTVILTDIRVNSRPWCRGARHSTMAMTAAT